MSMTFCDVMIYLPVDIKYVSTGAPEQERETRFKGATCQMLSLISRSEQSDRKKMYEGVIHEYSAPCA